MGVKVNSTQDWRANLSYIIAVEVRKKDKEHRRKKLNNNKKIAGSYNSRLKAIWNISHRKTFQKQEILKSSNTRKETADIDIW